jgi:hypothetical protein
MQKQRSKQQNSHKQNSMGVQGEALYRWQARPPPLYDRAIGTRDQRLQWHIRGQESHASSWSTAEPENPDFCTQHSGTRGHG